MIPEMPKCLITTLTDEELKELYDNLPFINHQMTYEEFKQYWMKKGGILEGGKNNG